MAENTTVAKHDVKSLIQSDAYKKQFAMVLPKHMTADRMVRVALTALIKTPALARCTPASVMQCLMDCSSYGLEPDGRRAHLIPYGDTCTLIVDYKGIAELIMRSGLVSFIHADVVCENDEFEENLGQVVSHKINRKKDRGEPYAVYTFVQMKDGTKSFRVMGKHEIEKIRDKYSMGWNGKGRESSPWSTAPFEMWKKTCFRQHSKWLPLSPEIRDAIEKDSDISLDVVPDFIGDAADAPTVNAGQAITPDSVEPPKGKTRKATAVHMQPNEPAQVPIDDDPLPLDTPANSEEEPREEQEPEPEQEQPPKKAPSGGPLAAPRRTA